MSTKKNKKRNPQPTKAMVRLSQCMIVKNEEKNIEKALSWGKGIVIEQIVVDTGSTDRTVEIAEKMGAKVFHFEWVNDFSAAKNFAIEQATGNWIAMLDADEYFPPEDAKTLYTYLRKIMADPDLKSTCLALNFPLVNVDDNGNPMSVYDQERLFRNIPTSRYNGKIHEMLQVPAANISHVGDLKVIHTGYADSVYRETEKVGRNIDLLRAELLERPNDVNLKGYLADALVVRGQEGDIAEAEALFIDVVNGDVTYPMLKLSAYRHLIEALSKPGGEIEKAEGLCIRAMSEFPGYIDMRFLYGTVLNRKEEYRAALKQLQECEAQLQNAKSLDVAAVVMAKPILLMNQLVIAAQGLNDLHLMVKYATMILAIKKDETTVLGPLIAKLFQNSTSEDEIIELLGKIYDLNNPKDMLIIARAAKTYGALDFAQQFIDTAKKMIEAM